MRLNDDLGFGMKGAGRFEKRKRDIAFDDDSDYQDRISGRNNGWQTDRPRIKYNDFSGERRFADGNLSREFSGKYDKSPLFLTRRTENN